MFSSIRRRTRPLARFGTVSVGTVYVLVGGLALLALAGVLTGMADEDRMVRVMMDVPGGAVMIWGIVAGLVGYTLWRVIETLADPYDFGHSWIGLTKRAGVGLSGLGYGFLAFSAARMALDGGGTDDESEERQQLLVAQVLEWPAGTWIVGGAGVILLIVALVQVALLVRRDYMVEIDRDALSPGMCNLVHGLAWSGYLARGVIMSVLGYFLIAAARRRDPEEVGDTDTAFDTIGGGMVGDTAFAIVALGTIAFGVYMYLAAVYYKFEHQSR
jgi:hypothetical protein